MLRENDLRGFYITFISLNCGYLMSYRCVLQIPSDTFKFLSINSAKCTTRSTQKSLVGTHINSIQLKVFSTFLSKVRVFVLFYSW